MIKYNLDHVMQYTGNDEDALISTYESGLYLIANA